MEIPLADIEPELPKEFWLKWLQDEIATVRFRFGNDEEALEFFPDDYYQRLEDWWSKDPHQEPIVVKRVVGFVRIVDGWHRVAISHKIGLTSVPVIWETP